MSRQIDYAAPLNRNWSVHNGLVARWVALPNLARGLTWIDVAGKNNGTFIATPSWGTLQRPGGYSGVSFDGANRYVDCGAASVMDGVSQQTIAFWGRRSAANAFLPVGKRNSSLYNGIDVWNDTRVYFQINPGFGSIVSNDTAWHHFAMVFDGAQVGNARIQGYLDGQVQTLTYSGTPPTTTPAAGNMYIGVDQIAGGSPVYANGVIDDVCIWNRALTAYDIAALYRDTTPCGNYQNSLNWRRSRSTLSPAIAVTPGVYAATTSSFSPLVTLSRIITPGFVSLGTSPYSPTALTPRTVTPGAAALSVTRLTPAATINHIAAPGTAALSVTKYAPTVLAPRVVIPGQATLSTTAYATTTLTPRTTVPGTQAISLTPHAATAMTPRTVTPAVAALAVTPTAATARINHIAVPDVVGLSLSAMSGHAVIGLHYQPEAAALSLATYGGVALTPRTTIPDPTHVSISGIPPKAIIGVMTYPQPTNLETHSFVPCVMTPYVAKPGVGWLEITTYDVHPDVRHNQFAFPPTEYLTLTTHRPGIYVVRIPPPPSPPNPRAAWPFSRVFVDHLFRGKTRVWWAMDPAFNDLPPYTFQLQTGYTSNPNALDWVNIGSEATNAYYLDDDAPREQSGKNLLTHYRVILRTVRGTYVSAPTPVWGNLNNKDWNLARELLRKEKLRSDLVSRPGYLLKRMRYGVIDPNAVDPITKAIIDNTNSSSWGTAYKVGYHPPVNVVADFDPKDIDEYRGGADITQNDARLCRYQVRILAFPAVAKEDVWVDAVTDERWMIGKISMVANVRGVPLVCSVDMSLIPFSDVIYRIPVTNLSDDPTDEDPFQPTVGTGCIRVDHDYGQQSALVYQTNDCCGISGATILAFRKSDWDAGNRVPTAAVASSQTTVNGTWAWAMQLNAGDYVLTFEKLGEYGPDVVHLHVTPTPNTASESASSSISSSFALF